MGCFPEGNSREAKIFDGTAARKLDRGQTRRRVGEGTREEVFFSDFFPSPPPPSFSCLTSVQLSRGRISFSRTKARTHDASLRATLLDAMLQMMDTR